MSQRVAHPPARLTSYPGPYYQIGEPFGLSPCVLQLQLHTARTNPSHHGCYGLLYKWYNSPLAILLPSPSELQRDSNPTIPSPLVKEQCYGDCCHDSGLVFLCMPLLHPSMAKTQPTAQQLVFTSHFVNPFRLKIGGRFAKFY